MFTEVPSGRLFRGEYSATQLLAEKPKISLAVSPGDLSFPVVEGVFEPPEEVILPYDGVWIRLRAVIHGDARWCLVRPSTPPTTRLDDPGQTGMSVRLEPRDNDTTVLVIDVRLHGPDSDARAEIDYAVTVFEQWLGAAKREYDTALARAPQVAAQRAAALRLKHERTARAYERLGRVQPPPAPRTASNAVTVGSSLASRPPSITARGGLRPFFTGPSLLMGFLGSLLGFLAAKVWR